MKIGVSEILVMIESQLFGDWVDFERLKLGFSCGEEQHELFGWKGLVLKMDEFILNIS